MNQKTKELLNEKGLLEAPEYTEEDLKILAEKLAFSDDPKAFNILKQLDAFGYDPILFEYWAGQTNKEYDYKAIFYNASQDQLPLILTEDLDSIEDIVLNWRFDRNK
jgi:hypothetical protein